MIMRSVFFLSLIACFLACSPAKKLGLKKAFESSEEKFQDHKGFVLYDLDENRTIYAFNSNRYFTPGSNTKILTFYTSLRLLGDSVPALKYIERNDSLIFWGTGDPSFLYKHTFNNFRVYNFLQQAQKPLFFSNSNFHTSPFGSGWAWDDYNDDYSAERSPFPVYGNVFTVERLGSLLKVSPSFFDQFLALGDRKKVEAVIRDVHSNDFCFHPGLKRGKSEWSVPMKVDQKLITDLLSDTLKRTVTPVFIRQPPITQPCYSILTDSLYSILMQKSDNFIAEQLLLMCADVVRDSLQPEIAIRYGLENFMRDLPDQPVWVDGSGLSRYNLITPRTIIELWKRIYALVPKERLFPLLATGGVSGTIKRWYKGDKHPYIFGKTGTLSNNHVLSGFLITKSGKTLIFAFMNNNYVLSTNDIRANMQEILYRIYENY